LIWKRRIVPFSVVCVHDGTDGQKLTAVAQLLGMSIRSKIIIARVEYDLGPDYSYKVPERQPHQICH
jgi:hypothetical protein